MMEWLKIREDLPEDPVVIYVAERCRVRPDEVVGMLVRFWRWARHQTADGRLPGVSVAFVDRMIGRKGFARGLADAPDGPWLVIESSGLRLPRWDEHNSKAAKERALARDRKNLSRSQRDIGHGDVPEKSRSEPPTLDETRQDKTREGPSQGSGPTTPPPKPRRKPSGPVQELLDWFRSEYERTQGSPYVITTKDAVQAARALKAFEPDDIRSRLIRGLTAADDAWLNGTDRALALLLGQLNRPTLRGTGPPNGGGKPARDPLAGVKELARRLDKEQL